MSRWRNWAGNQRAAPTRVVTPRSVDEVVAAVTASARAGLPVKAVGSARSSSAAAATGGTHVRPGGMTALRSVDPATGLVTVEHGMPLHALASTLDEHGLALTSTGGMDAPTVLGALSTATHGTGRDHAGLAGSVRGLEIVLADGTVVSCAPGDDLFEAARVSVGALGVVTAVTLQTEPAFLLHARAEPLPWEEVLDSFDAFSAGDEHWQFSWFPHTDRCRVERANRSPGPVRGRSRARRWRDDSLPSSTVSGALHRLGRTAPRAVPYTNRVSARLGPAHDYVASSREVFGSRRPARSYAMEYAVPRTAAVSALREVKALVDASQWLISLPVEVRVAPSDEVWLSTAHGRDTCYIACHAYERTDPDPYFRAVERLMSGYLGRPHWGTLHSRTAEELAPLYARWADWQTVRDRVDPERVFANDYTRQVFGD